MQPLRIVLPTPFAVGPVNAYLFAEDPVTLVDPGPLYQPAQEALRLGLAGAGISPRDVRRIVVTHHHPDHVGYAPELARRCGAELLLHPEAAERTLRPYGDAAANEACLLRNGVPGVVLDAMRRELERLVGCMAPLEDWRPIVEGDMLLAGGEQLKALVLPGHAPGHVCLQAAGYVVGGDLLIEGITPNPIFEVGPQGRRPSLHEYRQSLERCRALPSVPWLPGHRGDVRDPLALIDRYEEQMAARQGRVRELLARGPRTAFELSQELFPMSRGADPFLAVSETLGQLDALSAAGLVSEERRGDLSLYRSGQGAA